MKKLKVVLIGTGGRASDVVFPSLNDIDNVEIVGICDIDQQRMQRIADLYKIDKRYGAQGILDYQNMVNDLKPDAAVVVGQPHIMYDIWMWCLEQKLHLLIEKPLGLSIHQARALEAVAARNNVVTQVTFQRRYSPMVTQMREECLKRGPITHALCRFYKYDPRDSLGMRDHMMDDCVHSIDTLRWMCNSEVVKVESKTNRFGTVDINFISAVLHFENGATGHLINSWTSGKRIFAIEMHANGIFAEAEHEIGGMVYTDGSLEGKEYTAAGAADSDAFYVKTGVLAAVRDFTDCCINGGQPMSCFSDAVKTMKVAEIILAQSLLAEPLG